MTDVVFFLCFCRVFFFTNTIFKLATPIRARQILKKCRRNMERWKDNFISMICCKTNERVEMEYKAVLLFFELKIIQINLPRAHYEE